jgi:hypothetical protein
VTVGSSTGRATVAVVEWSSAATGFVAVAPSGKGMVAVFDPTGGGGSNVADWVTAVMASGFS